MRPGFFISLLGLSLIFTAIAGCSVKKNTGMSRFWHRLNTRYNGHFNGKEALREGMAELSANKKENYNRILTVFDYGAPDGWGVMLPYAERAIEKGAAMIRKHSMLINGKQHNAWIDDCYLIMGKGNYFKRDIFLASGQLRYVARESEKERTRQEAALWLFKLYVVAGEFADASTAMRLCNPSLLHKSQKHIYYATLAEYFIRQKRLEEALEPLETAVSMTKKKKLQARYRFIQGQIYESLGKRREAYAKFKEVLDLKPRYEMEFQTRMRLAQAAEDADVNSLRKQLRKMLRDEKNIDYLDQIYYALALLDLGENKKDEAMVNLNLSARNNKDNKDQRALTYQKMAEISLEAEKYELAQAYYDSTATDLSKDFPGYDQIIRLRDNLTAVVEQIRIIRLNDSLVMLARMDSAELRLKFTDYVEKLREEDEKAAQAEPERVFQLPVPGQGAAWYWVNEQARNMGRSEFKKIWGDRPNEDNWRRSKKSSDGQSGTEDDEEKEEKVNPRYDVDRYLADIPRTEEEIAACLKKSEDALFQLGVIYREKIQNIQRSNDAFLSLEKRFPESAHFPLAYYNLYLNYSNLKNQERAEFYKQKIIADFPTSEYARVLSDPGYLARKEAEANLALPAYQAAYRKYTEGNFIEARVLAAAGIRDYPESPELHRFVLLEALSSKDSDSLSVFKGKLRDLIERFDKTESAETASRLLLLLGDSVPVKKNVNPDHAVDTSAIEPKGPAKDYPYKFDEKAEHMVIIVIYDPVFNPEKLKNFVSNFNDLNYASKRLTVSNTLLGPKMQMLNIRRFSSAVEAGHYIKALLAQGFASQAQGVTIKPFAISLPNLAILFKDKDIDLYEEWYNEMYKE